MALLGWLLAGAAWIAWRTAARENYVRRAQAMTGASGSTDSSASTKPAVLATVKEFAATYGWVADPGKQALEMLRAGENCDWYSIKHSDEQHEAFDCLEIYWRTNVECPDRNEFHYGRGPFELKAGFRVRWRVAGTHHSCVEAVGLDLMSTILDAREQADRLMLRAKTVKAMGNKHPALDAWKARGDKREYGFHGLDVEKWSVRLDYPGGLSWADAPELDQAAADALAKAPV
jgi:hypothetical protein